ncbi:hypothetical protein [Rhodovulum adriaticum]|uniref:hypothetical protein n=1 Tax=Rhodovulum adriaticum TaxID=35804 RepID=UPI0010499019|nr:hypothetical protein [Rhodovulum adriaticum]
MKIEGAQDLHRFFLSIVWRAAASSLPDMSEVALNDGVLAHLREIILGERELSVNFMPVTLTQLSSRQQPHNMSPILDVKVRPPISGMPERVMPIVRLFMDGLVAHCHLNSSDFDILDGNELLVGGADELFISSVTYEGSFQEENLLMNMYETYLGPQQQP